MITKALQYYFEGLIANETDDVIILALDEQLEFELTREYVYISSATYLRNGLYRSETHELVYDRKTGKRLEYNLVK